MSTRSFTDAQRAEIVGILRDALRSDPSILREALERPELAERRKGAGSAAIAASLAHPARAVVPSGETRLKNAARCAGNVYSAHRHP